MPRYARVLVDESGSHAFDYELPEGVAGELQIGSRVRVPVRTRTALGTIIELRDDTDAIGVKFIAEVVDPQPVLNPILLRLATWLAEYYCCSLEAAMRAVLPSVIRKGELRHKQRLVARLAREFSPEEIEALKRRAPVQGEIVEFLAQAGQPVAVSELSGHAIVQALVKKGLVITEPAKVERDPFVKETFVGSGQLALNPEQIAVFARVKDAIEKSPSFSSNAVTDGGSSSSGHRRAETPFASRGDRQRKDRDLPAGNLPRAGARV
jgi:primosomal protein N' (replication factor Y)